MEALKAALGQWPDRREATQVLGAGLLVAVICWYFGVDVLHAILLGCAITVCALAGNRATSAPEIGALRWRPGTRQVNAGARNDVLSLSGSLRGGWGRVGRTAQTRLWSLARRRLALEGLDLRDAEQHRAIEQRLGRPAYRLLMRANARGRLSMRGFTACMDALDALDPTYYPAPRQAPRRTDRLMPPRRREPRE